MAYWWQRATDESVDRTTDEGKDWMVDGNRILKSLKQLIPKAK